MDKEGKEGGEYRKRITAPDKRKIRNLVQYRSMTDGEFDEVYEQKFVLDLAPVKELEDRTQKKLNEFEKDYDIDDLKINDKLALRALAQAFITLEDLENYSYKLRKEGMTLDNLTIISNISRQMSELRSDISKLQDDLKISRKIRKGDKEESVVAYIESLKEKAQRFYESKMGYVFCPKCNMLLATTWFLYNNGDNKITLKCERVLDSGEKCDGKITITSKELMKNSNSRTPENMR